jgi:hypothetical protein
MVMKIFFCYAHEDQALLNKLKAHLRPLQRQGLIEMWHDLESTTEKTPHDQWNARKTPSKARRKMPMV